eukprot:3294742-Pyramimonas_sp.AAC.1
MYRSIMLNSDVIKHHHAFLRSALGQCIKYLMVDSQTGGINGALCRYGVATVAAFYSLLRQAGIPLAGAEQYVAQ